MYMLAVRCSSAPGRQHYPLTVIVACPAAPTSHIAEAALPLPNNICVCSTLRQQHPPPARPGDGSCMLEVFNKRSVLPSVVAALHAQPALICPLAMSCRLESE